MYIITTFCYLFTQLHHLVQGGYTGQVIENDSISSGEYEEGEEDELEELEEDNEPGTCTSSCIVQVLY